MVFEELVIYDSLKKFHFADVVCFVCLEVVYLSASDEASLPYVIRLEGNCSTGLTPSNNGLR